MSFKFSFRAERDATTVPYAPIDDDIRHNRGFVDLRGRPDLAKQIAEGEASPALQNVLVKVADPTSVIFTLGCDLGSHIEPKSVALRRRYVAGGYLQIAGIRYHLTPTESYAALANTVVAVVRARSGKDDWKIDFVGNGVNFQFQNEPAGIQPNLWIWFFAAARDEFTAMQSRERLIDAIGDAFVTSEAQKPFTQLS